MPNHFTTVGIGSRKRGLGGLGEDEFLGDLATLAGANLCELALPVPEEIGNNVSTYDGPGRYVGDGEDRKFVRLTQEEERDLEQRFGAADAYHWCLHKWGTKCGTYGTKVHQLGGDGSPVLIEFQSAWGPPSSRMMSLITAYLATRFGFRGITWVGHDPYDGRTGPVEVGNV